jgi:hypothetical protein
VVAVAVEVEEEEEDEEDEEEEDEDEEEEYEEESVDEEEGEFEPEPRFDPGGYNVVCVHGVFTDVIALMHAYACMLSNSVLFERHLINHPHHHHHHYILHYAVVWSF